MHDPINDPATDVASIMAQLEIMTLKARHLRMLDTKDWTGYRDLLTEDFTLDVSAGSQVPVIHGRDAALTMVETTVGKVTTVHQAHIPEFQLQGDEAQVIWPIQDRVVRGADQPSSQGYGHHHDRWVRRNGHWKLASQRLTRLHVDVYPPSSGVKP